MSILGSAEPVLASPVHRVSPATRYPRKPKSWYDSPVLFAMSFVSALMVGARYGAKGLVSNNEMLNVAKNLVEDGSFANPYSVLATGPTAHVAPVYTLFLAGLYKLSGSIPVFEWIADRAALCIHGFVAALLVSVSRVFWATETPGLYGALASILLPVFLVLPGWESMASALGLILFCLGSHFALRTAEYGAAKGIAIGTFGGLLLLLNPALLVPAGLWLIFICRQSSLPSARRFAAAAAATCVLTCLPWMVRCYNRFGQVFPIRDNFGFELYAANNDCAEFSLARNMENGCHSLTHPNQSLAEARLVRSMGEANYSRDRMNTAIAWIKAHPRRFLALTVERFVHFWFPEPDFEGERLPVYSIWLLTTLSLVGLALIGARRIPVFWFIAAVFIFYPIPYYLVQSSARFLYPIFWLNLLCAGYCIETAASRFREGRRQRGDSIAMQVARSQS